MRFVGVRLTGRVYRVRVGVKVFPVWCPTPSRILTNQKVASAV